MSRAMNLVGDIIANSSSPSANILIAEHEALEAKVAELEAKIQQGCQDAYEMGQSVAQINTEYEKLKALIDTPNINEFIDAIKFEAVNQKKLHGSEDEMKSVFSWAGVLGYLAGKATKSHLKGDFDDCKHHIITAGALCANWHDRVKMDHERDS